MYFSIHIIGHSGHIIGHLFNGNSNTASNTSQLHVKQLWQNIKNVQFQNTYAGITIFSVHSQHLKSSSSAFRPALSNLWLPLVIVQKIEFVTGSRIQLNRLLDVTRHIRCCFTSVFGLVKYIAVVSFYSLVSVFPARLLYSGTSDLSTSDMQSKMSFLGTILRILLHPKTLMFLSVITIIFLLNRWVRVSSYAL